MNSPLISRRTRRALRSVLTATVVASVSIVGLAACSSSSGSSSGAPVTTAPAVPVDEEARALLPADLAASGTLKMTADFQYAPFTYLDSNGDYAGLDFDLGTHIAQSLGLTPEFSTESSFGSIVPSVQNGRVDAALESININPDRLKVVSFVGYISTFDVLLTTKGNPGGLDPANLCGANMAMTTGGASNPLLIAYSDACVADGQPEITLNEFGTTDASILALQSGRVDGFAVGSAVALVQTEASNGALESAGSITQLNSTDLMRSATAGVVIAKDNPGLGQAIQTVLQKMQADGSFLAPLESYGFDESAVVPASFVE